MPGTKSSRSVAATALLTLAGTVAIPVAAQARSSSWHPLTHHQAEALSSNVSDKVIVVFKNQERGTPDTARFRSARAAAVSSSQRGVLSELARTHAREVKSFTLINAIAATVSRGEAAHLAADPAVAEVVKDVAIPLVSSLHSSPAAGAAKGITPLPGACSTNGKAQLDPEAIEKIHAASPSGTGNVAEALGVDGSGVKVGFIADGLDINNPDFIRADGTHVFVDYQDFSGTGTNAPTDGGEAFLDASSVAAQGRHTYNIAGYGVGLAAPCPIKIRGVAPGASLVGLNVFGSSEFAFNSVFLEAINYAVNTDHVQVLNESFGSNPFPDTSSLDLTDMANNAAVKAGVTVTVSSGDAGITNTIGSPGTDPKIISAGASTTYRAYAQTGIGGITDPKVTGWLDNNISGLSSGGFAQDASTVDVVAPGDLNFALCSPNPDLYADCTNFDGDPASVELSGGTSEAAPLTAGVAALVIQAYSKTHAGHAPSPALVKRLIVSTAQDIKAPAEQQGAGMIDAYKAVLAAESYRGTTATATGHAILASHTQFHATVAGGSARLYRETLTNDGAGAASVHLSARTLSPYKTVSSKTFSLTASHEFAKQVTFTVPAGQARLDAAAALPGDVNVSLISPSGKLAEYNLPQGIGNYGDSQVAHPEAGVWTALVSTDTASSTVTAHFRAATATWRRFGTLSTHHLAIKAGGTASFTLGVLAALRPGDVAGSIVARNASATGEPAYLSTSTIPVTLRSRVATPHPTTSFDGVLTGGNGRDSTTGQTAYYQVRIPAKAAALSAQISTGNAANTFLAELVDPRTGQAESVASNDLASTTSSGTPILRPVRGAQLHILRPAAGVWTLVIDFYNTVSGTAVTQPFHVKLSTSAAKARVTGLPDSTKTKLPKGRATIVEAHVTNTGAAPEAYFIDGRLAKHTTLPLAAQSGAKLLLPNLEGSIPTYLVPSHTTSIRPTVSASRPLFFDYTSAFGDPDLISSIGKTATGLFKAPQVAPGFWTVTPFLVGPTGLHQAPSTLATTAMTARSLAFDDSVSSPTGDLWRSSISAGNGFTPYIVDPGERITIPVAIRPTGKAGTRVSGTLYLDDSSLVPSAVTFNELPTAAPQGSDVAAFHYRYTIR